ncbi:hypothetical protein BC834DRAFT_828524 [Gloeopeniophorella convolvens]|nr:hypothetical protein BC834DRAFT_828524 [Gloeopeniophorella convolvens]
MNKPAVESSVTRLLVSIKQLLESLTNWSNSKASEEEVSDVYVRLGNDFNVVVVAFAHYDIDMSELLSVPDDLRAVLEDCLSDDASTVALEKYLPNVRSIITKLLQGLRKKQSEYRNTTKRGLDASGHSRTGRQLSRPYRVSSRREVSKLQSSSISPLPSPPSPCICYPKVPHASGAAAAATPNCGDSAAHGPCGVSRSQRRGRGHGHKEHRGTRAGAQ